LPAALRAVEDYEEEEEEEEEIYLAQTKKTSS